MHKIFLYRTARSALPPRSLHAPRIEFPCRPNTRDLHSPIALRLLNTRSLFDRSARRNMRHKTEEPPSPSDRVTARRFGQKHPCHVRIKRRARGQRGAAKPVRSRHGTALRTKNAPAMSASKGERAGKYARAPFCPIPCPPAAHPQGKARTWVIRNPSYTERASRRCTQNSRLRRPRGRSRAHRSPPRAC